MLQHHGYFAGEQAAEQQKATFTTILRHEDARVEANACITRAVHHLDSTDLATGLLKDIAAFIVNRRS